MALIKCTAVRRGALLALLPFLAVLAGVSPPARATLAGANGKLAFTRGGQIYTADVGADLHALNLRQVTTYNGSSFGPAWSPDNSRIAFTRLVSGTNYELYEIGPTSQESKTNPAIRLTNNKRNDSSPTWSPDGSMIAFTSDRLDGNPAGDEDIFVMPSTPCAPAPCDPAVIDI